MLSIKEYANRCGKSEQAVYKQLRSKKNVERLKGHIQTVNGKKWLDDVAVSILDESKENAIIVQQSDQQEQIEALKNENAAYKDKIIELQEKLLESQKMLLEAKESTVLLTVKEEQENALKVKIEGMEEELKEVSAELEKEKCKSWIDKLLRR